MEPIISPWFIYLISVLDAIKVLCVIGGIISIIVWIIATGVGISMKKEYGDDDTDYKLCRNITKPLLPIWIIALTLGIFVPERKTAIAMYIGDKLTYDVAGKILDAGKDVKDELKKDVIDIIESITKDKETE